MHARYYLPILLGILVISIGSLKAETKDERTTYRPFRAKISSVTIAPPVGSSTVAGLQKRIGYRMFSHGGLALTNLGSGAGVGRYRVDRSIAFFQSLDAVVKANNFDAFIALWDNKNQKQVRQYFDANVEAWVSLVSYHNSCKDIKLVETFGFSDFNLGKISCRLDANPVEKFVASKRQTNGEYRLSLDLQGDAIYQAILKDNSSATLYPPCAIEEAKEAEAPVAVPVQGAEGPEVKGAEVHE